MRPITDLKYRVRDVVILSASEKYRRPTGFRGRRVRAVVVITLARVSRFGRIEGRDSHRTALAVVGS